MLYLLGKLLVWLLAAVALGFIIGWHLNKFFMRRKMEDVPVSNIIEKDDLQKIRGIGAALETRLNQLGIMTFRQIANWNKIDVENISKGIGPFPGRIKRDDWITQAKELVASKRQQE